ncbi:MAG TPA: hypothetical protein VIM72_01590 [Chitinophaga sp.]
MLALLFEADGYGWLDIRSNLFNEACLFFIYSSIYLLIPGMILTITVLTIRRSAIAVREKAVFLQS